MIPFMFASGVENSNPTIAHGRIRRDQMAECGHYDHWQRDFELARRLGIRFLRYGVPLHRSWLGPGRYDWDFADRAFGELRRLGIEPITDLCHFGVPDWVGNFQNPDFPALFAVYAADFARRYPWMRLYTPVNEMYVCARFSALYGLWNEQLSGERAYVTALKHLVKANLLAMHAIRGRQADAVFIQSESSEYFHATAPEAETIAETRNLRRFLSLDLNYGRTLEPDLRSFVLDNGILEDELRFFETHALHEHCILGTAWIPLGWINTAIGLAVATVKALLVAVVFMRLRAGHPLLRMTALAGLLTMALLFLLSGADYATRTEAPAPWQKPSTVAPRLGAHE